MVGFLCGTRAYEYVSLLVLSWYTISLVITSSFYEGLILSGGSISDFRPNFCVALEVLIVLSSRALHYSQHLASYFVASWTTSWLVRNG
jgi:hypothetical protein